MALTLLPISWTWDESMANKPLMRWTSAFTHSAFSSAFFSCQSLALDDFSRFVSTFSISFPRFQDYFADIVSSVHDAGCLVL